MSIKKTMKLSKSYFLNSTSSLERDNQSSNLCFTRFPHSNHIHLEYSRLKYSICFVKLCMIVTDISHARFEGADCVVGIVASVDICDMSVIIIQSLSKNYVND